MARVVRRWMCGRPTLSPPPSHHMFARNLAKLGALATFSAVLAMTGTKASATKTAVISTPTAWAIIPSTAKARLSIPARSLLSLQNSSRTMARTPELYLRSNVCTCKMARLYKTPRRTSKAAILQTRSQTATANNRRRPSEIRTHLRLVAVSPRWETLSSAAWYSYCPPGWTMPPKCAG